MQKNNSLLSEEGLISFFCLVIFLLFLILLSLSVKSYDPTDICSKLNISDCSLFWADINKTSSNQTFINITSYNITINQTINRTIYFDNSSHIVINDSTVTTNNYYFNNIFNTTNNNTFFLNHTEIYNNTIGKTNFSVQDNRDELISLILSVVDSKLNQPKPDNFIFFKFEVSL